MEDDLEYLKMEDDLRNVKIKQQQNSTQYNTIQLLWHSSGQPSFGLFVVTFPFLLTIFQYPTFSTVFIMEKPKKIKKFEQIF